VDGGELHPDASLHANEQTNKQEVRRSWSWCTQVCCLFTSPLGTTGKEKPMT
jgi:hypothetical protein